MSLTRRALEWMGFVREQPPAGILPPARVSAARTVTPDRAMTLSTVYRAIQIHATAASQMSIGVFRNDEKLEKTPAIVARPDLDQSLSAFIEYCVVSLYTDGNAFWRKVRATTGATKAGEVVDLKPLNPREVVVNRDPITDKVTYLHKGKTYQASDIVHLKFLRVPGHERGLGPIQAAQVEIRGALEARDYGSLWLSESSIPNGILSTDQPLGADDAQKYKNLWNGRNADGSEKENAEAGLHDIKVLGAGLAYTPLLLKPSEVQFLESQQFSTTQMARLLGVPASLLLAAVEGDSKTYSNVEQDWIAYIRFSLMRPLREIEEALTSLLPHTQVARFNIDALLRTDTKTRYEAHNIALRAGFATVNEIRALENMPPIEGGNVLAPTKEYTNVNA